MGATVKIEQVTNQESDLNQRLLYRAYDLILSWPLPETAVSDQAGDTEKSSLNPPNANLIEEDSQPV